jgi:hypothetical protein
MVERGGATNVLKVKHENELEDDPVGNGRCRLAGLSRRDKRTAATACLPTTNNPAAWDCHGYHSDPAG